MLQALACHPAQYPRWPARAEVRLTRLQSGLDNGALVPAPQSHGAGVIGDKHETLGQPVVPNGLPLSKIHHAAFDAHLIGIDPDYLLHVSGRLMQQTDGPMLEALKQLHHHSIRLPPRLQDRPDRDRLTVRFEESRAVN